MMTYDDIREKSDDLCCGAAREEAMYFKFAALPLFQIHLHRLKASMELVQNVIIYRFVHL